MTTFAINNFARRHTPTSPYSHFSGTWDQLLSLAKDYWDAPGARRSGGEGVEILTIRPPAHYKFFLGWTRVGEETLLRTTLAARQEGEKSYLQTCALGQSKQEADFVDLVFYANWKLRERNEQSTDKDFELVSVNARLDGGPDREPMTPMAMARNFLGLAGGTKQTYTAEDFANAIIFWSDRVNVQPE